MQLTNSSFTDYVTENILKPANLTNTYYWLGGQGMEPQGLRKGVVSIPGYLTTFSGGNGGTQPSAQPVRALSYDGCSSDSVACVRYFKVPCH